jgi:hypothetical protein
LQNVKLKKPSEKYLWFDIESDQSTGEHVPNHIHTIDFDGTERGFWTTDNFCKWVFTTEHKDFAFISHFGKGYYMLFIQRFR